MRVRMMYLSIVRRCSHKNYYVYNTIKPSITSCSNNREIYFSSTTEGKSLVTLKMEGTIAIIHLNNPTKLNALTVDMGEEFETTVDKICKDNTSDIRAVVVTGSGKAFSAGGEMNWLKERHYDEPHKNAIIMKKFYERYLCIRKLPVPTIAAINGAAIGAGMAMTMGCDMRIVSKTAQIGFTFVKLGLPPGMGSTFFLPACVGPQVANRLLLTGDVISGTEAVECGLAMGAVDQNRVLDEAISVAKRLAAVSPVAVRSTLRNLRQQQDEKLEIALQKEANFQATAYNSKDYLEGLTALIERRTPEFEKFG